MFISNYFSLFVHSDKEKRELVWTFGGGKRVCVGVNLINRLLKVRILISLNSIKGVPKMDYVDEMYYFGRNSSCDRGG